MENLEEFNGFVCEEEIEKGFSVMIWDKTDIQKLLNISEEQLEYLIERTGKQCAKIGWKRSFDINFKETSITSVGLYQLVYMSSELKKYQYLNKYISYLSELAINDLIRYQGFKQTKRKRKVANSNYDFEMQGEYDSKRYDSDLKVPNLDIEDKSHLFYDKKIVITGTFENFPKRQEMAEMIKNVGGDNNTSISKKTDFVIIGTNAGPSKMKKIEELGIKTLTETEFIKLFK
ncbi:MAG: BRCT domain-containing protein [Tenacibaculum sp.]|nr:BRCT domain-containing protein [Tenacibaculum sp.]